MGNLVRRHGRIADKDHFVVGRVLVKNVPGAGGFIHPPDIIFPDTFIDEIVEIEIFHVLEFEPCGRKQLLTDTNVGIHGAAHIEKDQHFHSVMPFGHHLQIQITGIAGSGTNRVVHIQLVCRTLAGELT